MEVDTDTLGVDESFAVYGSDGETELKFDFSSHIKDSEPTEEDAEGTCLEPHESALIPFTHSYLGELYDVGRHHAPIIFSNQEYVFPTIKITFPVFPGQIVPVWRYNSRMLAVANWEDDLAGYVVMVWLPSKQVFTHNYWGCIAKILQISGDGRKALIQGVCKCKFPDWKGDDAYNFIPYLPDFEEVLVLARPDICPPSGQYRSHLDGLANSALAVFHRNYPRVGGFEGDPVQVAYWLAANAPLGSDVSPELSRWSPQMLLERFPSVSADYKVLTCRGCDTEVADAEDLIQVVDQGPCLVCAWPGLIPEKFICLGKEPRGVRVWPRVFSQNNWFPGYACQRTGCICGTDLGWVFTALEVNMPIQKFWALNQHFIEGHTSNPGPAH